MQQCLLTSPFKQDGYHHQLEAQCQFENAILKIHFTVHFTAMARHASYLYDLKMSRLSKMGMVLFKTDGNSKTCLF